MPARGNVTTRYIRIEGSKELRRALRQLEDQTEKKALAKELKAEYRRAAETVAERARRYVNSDTGALARSIKARGALRGAAVIAGSTKVPYAAPLEYGWPSRPNKARKWRGGPITEQRYLRRSAKEGEGLVVYIMEQGVKRMMRKVEEAAK